MANKPLKIFTSILTNPPRYYASTSYKVRDVEKGIVEITGKKWDVTEDIKEIIRQHDLEVHGA